MTAVWRRFWKWLLDPGYLDNSGFFDSMETARASQAAATLKARVPVTLGTCGYCRSPVKAAGRTHCGSCAAPLS